MKYLPEWGENLFQRIKRLVREYEEKHWVGSSINIAVGEPDTTPPEALRKLVAEEVLRDDNANHTYWDNRSHNRVNQNFIELNTGINVDEYEHLSTLIIPGEKPMIGLLPICSGANRDDVTVKNTGYMRNAPAYDLIGTWGEYLGEQTDIWPIYSSEDFKLDLKNMPKEALPRVIVTVKPWNPCPVWASREEWVELIEFCIENNIRLVNDGAYTAVVHEKHVSLTEVAKDYKDLDWIELFSMSKTYSACGWRFGVVVWSWDFVDEFTKIKGNTDSGPFGPLIIGMERYLETPDAKKDAIATQQLYKKRLDILIPIFEEAGLELSCPTEAGFFMLFRNPNFLNGELIETSEQFNSKMIDEIGLVWVPFTWSEVNGKPEQFIRYSACYDALNPENIARLKEALSKVKIGY